MRKEIENGLLLTGDAPDEVLNTEAMRGIGASQFRFDFGDGRRLVSVYFYLTDVTSGVVLLSWG